MPVNLKFSGGPPIGVFPPAKKVTNWTAHLDGPQEKKQGSSMLPKPMGHDQVVGTVSTQYTKKKDAGPVSTVLSNVVEHPGLSHETGAVTIEVGGGRTFQPAPFESVRIDVRISMRCAEKNIPEVYTYLTDWVGEKLAEAENAAKGKL